MFICFAIFATPPRCSRCAMCFYNFPRKGQQFPKKRSATTISQEEINDFYNFPKDEHYFGNQQQSGNLRSRAVKKSAEWKCQHKKPTQHPTLLFWISYSTILKLQIFESSTHTKKHIASLAESESRVINSNTPPNVWKDHNHLSTKKTFKRHCATDQESQLMYKVTPWISKDFDLVQAILVGVLCNWSQCLALYVVSNRSQSDKICSGASPICDHNQLSQSQWVDYVE